MRKFDVALLILRALQFPISIAFLVFWAWSCTAGFVVGGGAGAYVLGFLAGIASLAISAHGIVDFVRKRQHRAPQTIRRPLTRCLLDLLVVVLWLATILVALLVPVPVQAQWRSLYGGPTPPSASEDVEMGVVAGGVNGTQLFLIITFFTTFLLLIVPAVQARKARGEEASPAANEEKGVGAQEAVRAPTHDNGDGITSV